MADRKRARDAPPAAGKGGGGPGGGGKRDHKALVKGQAAEEEDRDMDAAAWRKVGHGGGAAAVQRGLRGSGLREGGLHRLTLGNHRILRVRQRQQGDPDRQRREAPEQPGSVEAQRELAGPQGMGDQTGIFLLAPDSGAEPGMRVK